MARNCRSIIELSKGISYSSLRTKKKFWKGIRHQSPTVAQILFSIYSSKGEESEIFEFPKIELRFEIYERKLNVVTTTCITSTAITLEIPELQRSRGKVEGKCRNKFIYTVSSHPTHFYSIASRIYPRHYVPEYLVTRAAVYIYETICIEFDIVSILCSFSPKRACMPPYMTR